MSITPTTLVGNLTSDPELSYTTGGTAKLAFGIAVNSSWTDQQGEKQEKTSYFNIVAWGYLAENSASVLEKGIGVVIHGALEQRSWEDKEGNKRSTVGVKAQEIGIRTGSLESIERRKAKSQQESNLRGDLAKPKRAKPASVGAPDDEPF